MDENGSVVRVTSAHPGAVEPVGKWDAGAWGTPNRSVAASTDLRLLIIRLLRTAPLVSSVEEAAMERLIERCAGLDVHKASVTATV